LTAYGNGSENGKKFEGRILLVLGISGVFLILNDRTQNLCTLSEEKKKEIATNLYELWPRICGSDRIQSPELQKEFGIVCGKDMYG
jgi:hypothetical protein